MMAPGGNGQGQNRSCKNRLHYLTLVCGGGLRNTNRLKVRHHLFLAIRPPRWQMQLRAQLVARLVSLESFADVAAALYQNPARAAAVHGMEIEPVLNLRGIGIPELFIDCL